MNWLNFLENGGESFTQDDILWLANGLKAALGQGFSIRGVNTYVMNGMRSTLISGTTYGHTAGVVIINGEVCLIDADTTGIDVSAFPYRYIEPVVTYDSTGLIPFATGGPYNLYQITKYVVNGYATSQTGKIRLDTLPYFEDLINDIVFSQGAAVTISGGLIELPAFDNIFQVNISSTDTLNEIIKFDPSMTMLWLQFVGTNPTDTVTINNGNILTPGGLSYVFKSGDWVMLIADGSTPSYNLVTKGGTTSWQPVTSFGTGWQNIGGANTLRFLKDANGIVTINGAAGNTTLFTSGTNILIFTLPIGYRPTQNVFKYIYNEDGADPCLIYVGVGGDVNLYQSGLSGVNIIPHLDIQFPTL